MELGIKCAAILLTWLRRATTAGASQQEGSQGRLKEPDGGAEMQRASGRFALAAGGASALLTSVWPGVSIVS